jgi:hypothetical protein
MLAKARTESAKLAAETITDIDRAYEQRSEAAYREALEQNKDRIDNEIKGIDLLIKARQRSLDIAADAEAQMRSDSEKSLDYGEYIYKRSLDDRADATKSHLEQIKELEDKAAKDRKAAFDDIRQSAGAIFDDMLKNGESVFSSLGNALKGGALSLGRSIFQDITAHLFGPTKAAFDRFMSGIIGGTVGKLGDKIGGVISGALGIGAPAAAGAVTGGVAAGGAAAGGTVAGGSVAGGGGLLGLGSATIPVIGGAIAGITLLATKLIGRGRRTADEFVQNFQNPFGDLIGQITDVGEFDQAVSQFWGAAQQFASQGGTQAKVVSQAHNTLDDLLTRRRADLVAQSGANITIVQQPGEDTGELINRLLRYFQSNPAAAMELSDLLPA